MRSVLHVLLFAALATSVLVFADGGADEGWTLQFSDDFERPNAGAHWQVVAGDWRIRDGMLRGGPAASIVCTWQFSGSVRLEYEAVATGDDICDLSAIVDTVPGGGVEDSLFFGFGSEHNTVSKLLVRGREVQRSDARIVLGKRHQIVCLLEGDTLTHIIDGEVVATCKQDGLTSAPNHGTIGLYTYAGGAFDNVRVFTRDGSASKPASRAIASISCEVSLIEADIEPVSMPGPGRLAGQGTHVALDWNNRSLFIDLGGRCAVRRVVLVCDPAVSPARRDETSNRSLSLTTLELYSSNDNVTFIRQAFELARPDECTVVLDGFDVDARYLKVRHVTAPGTDYAFINALDRMVRVSGTMITPTRLGFEIEDPLFQELFSDTPAPTQFLSYSSKYEGRTVDERGEGVRRLFRATAKRFGLRYVWDEQLDFAAEHGFIPLGPMDEPAYEQRGIASWAHPTVRPRGVPPVSLPGESLPMVVDGRGWLLDPRFLDQLASDVEERAREGRYWGIAQLDEIWTYYAIKPVPRDAWYKQVEDADREIREQYGFGRFGMPETHEGGDPFERIAHRRWASGRLVATFARAHERAKAINPEMRLIGPTHGSSGTSADMEAWAPYFDILGGQCAGGHTQCLIDWVRPGALTKLYVDLTEKPVWMMVHLAKDHARQRDPEYIREMYSQVFRNGGQNVWLMSSEFFEEELEDAEFAEPDKWRAMVELSEMISTMRLPRLPEQADCAILFSSDSSNATTWGGIRHDSDRTLSAYTVLGPCLRSWPQFVTDRQIERGDRDLSHYRVLYLPYAPYGRASVLERIKSYVRSGGIVVCTDTEAFKWDISGEPLDEQWTELTGVRRTGPRRQSTPMRTAGLGPLPLDGPISLTALVAGSTIEPVDDEVVKIAVFEDGAPAVTLHRYGEGSVIFFAADPFCSVGQGQAKRSTVEQDAPVVALIAAIQEYAGAQLGHDIWRFRLPPFRTDIRRRETGLCLTNNYVHDVNVPLLEPNNLDTGGTYSYDRPPSFVRDVAEGSEQIAFSEGHLTNRLAAFETRNQREWRGRDKKRLDAISADWIVAWDDSLPVSVTFDLKRPHALARLRVYYSGTLPAAEVSGSRDGEVWQALASVPGESVGEDVRDVTVPLAGEHQYVKLDFAAVPEGARVELCEVEIWAPPQ